MEPAVRSREKHAPSLAPLDAFARVARFPGVAFLDGGGGRSHLAWEPVRRLVLEAGGDGDPVTRVARFVDGETNAGRTVIGALSYDLRTWIEPRAGRPSRGGWPLAVLHSYDRAWSWDRGEWNDALPDLPPPARDQPARLGRPRAALDRAGYRRLFLRLHDALLDGDVYQANLALAFDAELAGAPAALYRRLSASHPVPFGAYFDCGAFQLLSNSPELFLERTGDRIVTRPIKGTRRRGADPVEDARLVRELERDPKERAEHLMILDLERNDLGRIAAVGTVAVEAFARVVTLGSLHHLESTVSARLRDGVDTEQMLRATFPGGSITGAPKVRAMQLIDELEPDPRSFYTGAIVHGRPGGGLTASIAIRTAIVSQGCVRYFAGGGIVVDSTPEAEYDECLLKAKAFFACA